MTAAQQERQARGERGRERLRGEASVCGTLPQPGQCRLTSAAASSTPAAAAGCWGRQTAGCRWLQDGQRMGQAGVGTRWPSSLGGELGEHRATPCPGQEGSCWKFGDFESNRM